MFQNRNNEVNKQNMISLSRKHFCNSLYLEGQNGCMSQLLVPGVQDAGETVGFNATLVKDVVD